MPSRIERKPRAPVLRRIALRAIALCVLVEAQFDAYLEHALILLRQRVLRPRQDFDKRTLIQILERCQDRQAADEFGDR